MDHDNAHATARNAHFEAAEIHAGRMAPSETAAEATERAAEATGEADGVYVGGRWEAIAAIAAEAIAAVERGDIDAAIAAHHRAADAHAVALKAMGR